MTKATYKGKHLIRLRVPGEQSPRWQEQLRAHIYIHKPEPERAHRKWPKSLKPQNPTPVIRLFQRVTTVPSQVVPPYGEQVLKHMSKWDLKYPSLPTTKVYCMGWGIKDRKKVNEGFTWIAFFC